MQGKIPIIKLKKDEKLWLTETYNILKTNARPDFKKIWQKLYGKISKTFRPNSMDERLVSANGEELKLLGVVALEKSYSILDKCNRVLNITKKLILENPDQENYDIQTISEKCGLPIFDTGFVFYLARDFGSFFRGSSYDSAGHIIMKSIQIKGDDSIFNRYIAFEKIEDFILNRQKIEQEKQFEPRQKFTPLTQTSNDGYIKIKPVFHSRVDRVNRKLCFLIMPFKEPWSERVFRLLRKNMNALGFQLIRSDDLTKQNIIEDIWCGINQSAFIIADMTNKNPNVMYEMGIVHTVGKPSILITQDIDNIPFDFRHLRHIEYRDNIEDIKKFIKALKQNVVAVYNDNYPDDKIGK